MGSKPPGMSPEQWRATVNRSQQLYGSPIDAYNMMKGTPQYQALRERDSAGSGVPLPSGQQGQRIGIRDGGGSAYDGWQPGMQVPQRTRIGVRQPYQESAFQDIDLDPNTGEVRRRGDTGGGAPQDPAIGQEVRARLGIQSPEDIAGIDALIAEHGRPYQQGPNNVQRTNLAREAAPGTIPVTDRNGFVVGYAPAGPRIGVRDVQQPRIGVRSQLGGDALAEAAEAAAAMRELGKSSAYDLPRTELAVPSAQMPEGGDEKERTATRRGNEARRSQALRANPTYQQAVEANRKVGELVAAGLIDPIEAQNPNSPYYTPPISAPATNSRTPEEMQAMADKRDAYKIRVRDKEEDRRANQTTNAQIRDYGIQGAMRKNIVKAQQFGAQGGGAAGADPFAQLRDPFVAGAMGGEKAFQGAIDAQKNQLEVDRLAGAEREGGLNRQNALDFHRIDAGSREPAARPLNELEQLELAQAKRADTGRLQKAREDQSTKSVEDQLKSARGFIDSLGQNIPKTREEAQLAMDQVGQTPALLKAAAEWRPTILGLPQPTVTQQENLWKNMGDGGVMDTLKSLGGNYFFPALASAIGEDEKIGRERMRRQTVMNQLLNLLGAQ